MKLIQRNEYLQKSTALRDKQIIKVITGIRRVNALEWLMGDIG